MRKKEARPNESDNRIFKVEAQGDTLYIQAPTQEDAHLQLTEKIGPIPDRLLTWGEVKKLPKGEEFL
jgi:hypothetical protein